LTAPLTAYTADGSGFLLFPPDEHETCAHVGNGHFRLCRCSSGSASSFFGAAALRRSAVPRLSPDRLIAVDAGMTRAF